MSIKKDYKAGDIVRVINDGQTYTTYVGWALTQKLKNWKKGLLPTEGHEYTVVVVAEHDSRDYGTLVAIKDAQGAEYIVGVGGLELVKGASGIDFAKPVFTAEGTPVQIVTTEGRDPKFPVLGYEGKATILSKFTLAGKNKNGEARRHLTNRQAPEVPKEYFVNLYEGDGTTSDPITGSNLHESLADAMKKGQRSEFRNGKRHVGVAKVTLVQGKYPKLRKYN